MTHISNERLRPMEDRDRQAVLALSRAWAEEGITYGYFANGEGELDRCRCWVAEADGSVVGYAAGQMETASRDSSIQRAGDQWFELEALYVDRAHRSRGLGAGCWTMWRDSCGARASGGSCSPGLTGTRERCCGFTCAGG